MVKQQSTDHKGTKAERELQNSETDEILLTKQAPEDKEEEEEKEEEEAPEELGRYECCFETEDADGNDYNSIFVGGLDTCLARDDIKTALRKHFESYGCQVTRVFVPIQCRTGVPLGFAFVDVDDEENALLASRFLGRRLILITLAEERPESTTYPNFEGCKRCGVILSERRMKRFLNGSRLRNARSWI